MNRDCTSFDTVPFSKLLPCVQKLHDDQPMVDSLPPFPYWGLSHNDINKTLRMFTPFTDLIASFRDRIFSKYSCIHGNHGFNQKGPRMKKMSIRSVWI